jgi:ankyrin repeat protein
MTQLSSALRGLKPLSDPYDVVYANAMQRLRDDHETEHTKLGLTTICWLFLAKRPLRLRELLHVLAIDEDIPSMDEGNIPLVSHVLNACAGLVVIDETHDSISFFHKTFYEYLIKSQSTWFPHGDETIGLACVTYLSFDAFAGGPCTRPEPKSLHFSCQAPDRARYAYEDRLAQHPLYSYAQQFWHHHIRGSESETSEVILNFLREPTKVSASCQRHGLESLAPLTTGTHVAAAFSLERSLKRHLELCRPYVNVKDHSGRSPLSYAAEVNGLMTIDHLINAGADPDFEDSYHRWDLQRKSLAHTPLSYAALKGHLLACKALVQEGSDVNYRDSRGRSALSYAADGASEGVARLLLRKGSLIDSLDSEKLTPLCWAGASGSCEVASLLLDHGANINRTSGGNRTPLLVAAKAGHERMISLLIARGADVNILSYSDETSLSLAVQRKLVDSVRLLLHAGADVNQVTKPTHPLTQATDTGSKEIVQLLVAAGSDVNQRDAKGLSPLDYAAKNGWTDVVQLLLDKGADPNNTRLGPRSALSYAVVIGSIKSVEVLLERGADINRPTGVSPYCELLHEALGMVSRYGGCRPADEDMLKLLLTRGANPNQMMSWEAWREDILDPPLLYALQCLPSEDALTQRLAKLLLEHGAKIDVKTRKGVSISACAKRHSKEVQDLLHQYGVR